MTAPQNPLEQAKQGNPKAIEFLINRTWQSKGIIAKVVLIDGCLQVMLESAQSTNKQELVTWIINGITNLNVTTIKRVKIYGKEIGVHFPSWGEEFDLREGADQPTSIGAKPVSLNTIKNLNTQKFSSFSEDKFQYFNVINYLVEDKEDLALAGITLIYLLTIIGSQLVSPENNGFVDGLIEGIGGASFLFLIALIPAVIANKKGRKFSRWLFLGFLLFPVALLMSLLIKKNNQPVVDVFEKFRTDITSNPKKWIAYFAILLVGMALYFDPFRHAAREAVKESRRSQQELEQELKRIEEQYRK